MKRFLLYIIFIFTAFSAAAQQPEALNPQQGEKIRALYTAYISQQLQLTPDEAQRFWPLHAQYEGECGEVYRSNLSGLDKQQRILDIKKKYQPQFEGVIGRERSNKFYLQNDQFRDKLLQIRQQRREMKQADGGRLTPRDREKFNSKRENILRN